MDNRDNNITNNNLNNLYTIKQASDITGISEETIIRLSMLKKIKTVRIGKSIKIAEEELDKIINYISGDNISEKTNNQVKKTINQMNNLKESRLPIIFTAEEVAEILNLSVDNVWLLLKSGQLKGFKIRDGRSSWRIPQEYLNEFIEERIKKTSILDKHS